MSNRKMFVGSQRLVFVFSAIAGLGTMLAAQAGPNANMISVGTQPRMLSVSQAAAADKTATLGRVSADKKTLMFQDKLVRLVVRSGPANDMLSYRIDGLRNPTLVVLDGAIIKVLFINTDDDMPHNLRFTMQKMPFKSAEKSVGTSNLPHKSKTTYYAEDLTLRVLAAGTYTYFCTVPGHAPGGMFGTLIVK